MAKKILYKPTDPAIQYTEDEIKELEAKITKVYAEAEADIQKKMDDFNAKFQKKDLEYQKQLKDGLITQADYDDWKKGQVFTGKQWKAKKDEIAAVLHNSNNVTTHMINMSALGVFGENSNYMAYSLEHTAGVNFGFGLYNTDAVAQLVKDDPQLLPKWKVNEKKDYDWNQKNINMALTQGIIQGESLNKISKRVSTSLAGKNANLMNTFAKTGMTQAQNSGRVERLSRGKVLGLNVQKEWVATLDNHTRVMHQDLDGQKADVDGYFHVDGLKIRYPGDPEAHPSLVYNCRCAVVGDLTDYPATYNRYDNIAGEPIKGMSYHEWKEAKTFGDDITPVPLTYDIIKKAKAVDISGYKNMLFNQVFKSLSKQPGMLDQDLYKLLHEDYSKSATDEWYNYVNGALSADKTKKIDELLAKAGPKPTKVAKAKAAAKATSTVTPAPTPTVNVADAFKDKKMSNIKNEISSYDVTAGNKFYYELYDMGNGKPSQVWKDYLEGKLDADSVAKINAHLEKHLKNLDKVTVKVPKAKAAVDPDEKKLKELKKHLKKYEEYEKEMSGGIGSKGFVFEKDGNKVTMYNLSDVDYAMKLGYKPADADAIEFVKWTKGVTKESLQQEIGTLELKKMQSTMGTKVAQATDVDELEKAKKKLAAAEKDLKDKFDMDTKYSGIWKEDVTLADYEAKKGKIAAKKKYFEDQIDKYSGPAYANSSWAPKEIEKFEDLLQGLEEFEEEGKAASKYLKAVEAAKKEVRALTPVGEAYTEERKAAALWAKTNSEYKAADKYYDKVAKTVHKSKTAAENEGYYHYTWGSGPFNQPLAGFDGSWSDSAFKGVGKVNIDKGGYGDKIRGLTTLCEKSKYDKDFWVQSGQSTDTLAGFLNIPRGSFDKMTDAELQQFVGVQKEIPQFISGAINKGGGSYTPGDMLFNIYCPSGSEALYVQSDGRFGKAEHEMILQRGGTYRIDKIYWGKDTSTGRKKLIVDLELRVEEGYHKFQQ